MISESTVCLDRRVVSPPAVESGGSTTWTLPYDVAVDGSEGRIAVVRLDTATELTVSRPSASTVSAVGSHSGAPVAVGIAYTWRYVLSTIYMRGPDGRIDRRAVLRLGYVRALLSGTRHLNGTITAPDRDVCAVVIDDPAMAEGQQLTLPVFADSKTATLELSSDAPWPVRIGALEWDGQYDPTTATQVP